MTEREREVVLPDGVTLRVKSVVVDSRYVEALRLVSEGAHRLGELQIADWNGVRDQDGHKVPVTPETIRDLFRRYGMADAFLSGLHEGRI